MKSTTNYLPNKCLADIYFLCFLTDDYIVFQHRIHQIIYDCEQIRNYAGCVNYKDIINDGERIRDALYSIQYRCEELLWHILYLSLRLKETNKRKYQFVYDSSKLKARDIRIILNGSTRPTTDKTNT